MRKPPPYQGEAEQEQIKEEERRRVAAGDRLPSTRATKKGWTKSVLRAMHSLLMPRHKEPESHNLTT